MKTRVWAWAFGVSFVGSLPAGVLNVSVAGLVVQQGWLHAAWFGVGAIIAEILVVHLALLAANKVVLPPRWKRYLNYAIIALLFFMAFSSISAALQRQSFAPPLPVRNGWTFVVGFFLSFINPFHLPFWLGWTLALRARQVLPPHNVGNAAYLMGIAWGTAAAFLLYGFGAQQVASLLQTNQFILNWAIGIGVLVAALVQLARQILPSKPKHSD
jgi:threonine/homoserine/homoserine lactone efflux protein